MNRRTAIARLLTGIGATALYTSPVIAAQKCSDYDERRLRRCAANVDERWATITAAAVNGQHMSNWCWAACIEMVFRFYGFIVPQAHIVQQTWGTPANLPANVNQLLASLNRPWVDAQGRAFGVEGNWSTVHLATVVADLQREWPLIIGTMGHAMLLGALHYEQDTWDRIFVRRAFVLDPWPGKGKRDLTEQEWKGIQFVVRIRLYAGEQSAGNRVQQLTPGSADCNPRVQNCSIIPGMRQPSGRLIDCNPRVQRCD